MRPEATGCRREKSRLGEAPVLGFRRQRHGNGSIGIETSRIDSGDDLWKMLLEKGPAVGPQDDQGNLALR
ncbi:MAG: hypothetical protein WB992_23680 [Bryobacteraceae bacterium]